MIIKGYLSHSSLKSLEIITIDNVKQRRKIQNANKIIKKLENFQEYLRSEIVWTKVKQKEFVNKHRHSISKFRVNAMMFLNARYQFTRRENKFLDVKNLNLYRIVIAKNNIIYELNLLESMSKIFLIFHFWLLHLDDEKSFENQKRSKFKFTKLDDDLYYIDEILNFKINRRRIDLITKAKRNCLKY